MVRGKDMAIVIAWPQCWAKAPESVFAKLEKLGLFKSIYFQLGHAGVVLINGADGQVEYFDFGRYSTGSKRGRVRSRRSDPKLGTGIRARFGEDGELMNFRDILRHLKLKQEEMHGEGAMHVSLCTQFDYQLGHLAAECMQDAGSLDYGSIIPRTTNCANFVQKILLAGVQCKKTRFWLRFPLTFLQSTPLGNVEAIRSAQNYIITDREIITKKRRNQWQVVKYIFRAIVVNVTGKRLQAQSLNHLEPPDRSPGVPPEAQWLGGQGEGTWLTLLPIKDQDKLYRIKGLSANGETEYDFFAKANATNIDPDKPYRFMIDCSRLGATIVQDSQKIRLTHYQDYPGTVS